MGQTNSSKILAVGDVLITGGGSGIGAATAAILAQRGACVYIADRDEDQARSIADALVARGMKARSFYLDVADPISIREIFEQFKFEHILIDGLVNCAGTNVREPALEASLEDWQKIIDVNLRGTMLACRAFAEHSSRNHHGGSIVNITSMLAHYAAPNLSSYAASKSGVAMLTRCLAIEWAGIDIRVNAVSPGYIKTPMSARSLAVTTYREMLERRTPMGRLGLPDDVAKVIAFFMSPDSAFITGQVLPVDGGITAGDPLMSIPADSSIQITQ